MIEIWKEIKGYEGLYEVSNLGNVRSFDRYGLSKNNSKRLIKGRILKKQVDKDLYEYIGLTNLNNERKYYRVHRLVAEAFIPNPDNLPIINHKDEKPDNNCVDNLEWCTYQYNNTYGNRIFKSVLKRKGQKVSDNTIIKTSKQIYCVDKYTGEILNRFISINRAEKELGIASTHISACCKGKRKTCGGYKWSYV